MSASSDGPAPPKAGWYDDPSEPGRDRWWTGYQWSSLTSKAPRRSYFPPEYERSLRPTLNRDAKFARRFTTAAVIACLLLITLGWVAQFLPRSALPLLAILLVAALCAAVAGIIFGARALPVAAKLGGFGLAVITIVQGSVLTFSIGLVGVILLVASST